MMEQTRLSSDEKEALDRFHRIWYHRKCYGNATYLGVRCIKNPFDLWIYQELIYAVKPDLIIECGSFEGGSALFFSQMQKNFTGGGKVVSIDLNPNWDPKVINHPDIITIPGNTNDPQVLSRIRDLRAQSGACLVILDSDHSKKNVLAEMENYGPMVTKGSYLIVEDGNVNGHPVLEDFGEGPYEAVQAFLPGHPEFKRIRELEEKFMFTFAVCGFLQKIA